jgi:hypothetical protein
MEKKMYDVKIYTSDKGYVCIEQEDIGSDNSIIILAPDQIDILCQWLKKAKESL